LGIAFNRLVAVAFMDQLPYGRPAQRDALAQAANVSGYATGTVHVLIVGRGQLGDRYARLRNLNGLTFGVHKSYLHQFNSLLVL
jgi:hypothetical protein